ncbi:MAG TPA: hypothetical protein PLO05_11130 [Bacteroidales bacterium]|jgi:hypothetical protein|nr:hypothetical protein [Bacteroidales bacterium]MDD4235338.1 hypothetical protein [Bacteroidales bacterium]HRW21907.1 hypothetical protein [Bacteroidales bacterium]HXK82700.1 hypothetical protein [Bacteroidales bacterium]
MKNILFISMAIAMGLVIFSCNNTSEQNKDEPKSETNKQAEQSEANDTEKSVNEVQEVPEKTIEETKTQNKVKSFTGMFDILAPATDGTWFLFSDKDGNEYKFYDNGDCQKARDLFFSVQPMDNDHQYQSTEFFVEYKTEEIEFYNKADGGTIMREVDVITNIEEK